MSDIFDQEKRSEIMSSVNTEGTDIEKILGECVKPFWDEHRYRKNKSDLPGSPDVVFLKSKLAVFADGDFWHGKNFDEWKDDVPEFWREKISKNISRDERQTKELEELGYTVLRFWGSELKNNRQMVIEEIRNQIDK